MREENRAGRGLADERLALVAISIAAQIVAVAFLIRLAARPTPHPPRLSMRTVRRFAH
jgi:hypothetical protein